MSAGATVSSEMKERSAVATSTRAADPLRLEPAHVRAFEHRDARVGAQRPRELAAPDVDRHDMRGARPQQTVGEATGGRARVERTPRR